MKIYLGLIILLGELDSNSAITEYVHVQYIVALTCEVWSSRSYFNKRRTSVWCQSRISFIFGLSKHISERGGGLIRLRQNRRRWNVNYTMAMN